MKSKFFLLSLLVFVTIMFALPAVLRAELKEGVTTQGEFALWLVKVIGAESKLPPAATGKDALDFLKGLGVIPEGGWKKDEPVTKAFLSSLLEGDTSNLSFDELVNKVQQTVKDLVSDKKLGVFRGTNEASGSVPTT